MPREVQNQPRLFSHLANLIGVCTKLTFPFVFSSGPSGINAISLQGSKREYLLDLLIMFWTAPTSTASIRGVVPIFVATGAHQFGLRMREKKPAPVVRSTVGVTRAANPHPRRLRIVRPASIMAIVQAPVADENVLRKAEYSVAPCIGVEANN